MNTSSLMARAWRFIRKPWILAAFVLAIIIIGSIVFFVSSGKTDGEVVKAERMTVSEEVAVSGKVKSASDIDLSFETSGRVARILKRVGDPVKAGDTIAVLDTRNAQASLAEALASVRIEQAKLAELQAGTRPEALDVTQTKLSNAEQDVSLAKQNLVLTLQAAYTSADDAVRSKADTMFVNPRSPYPKLIFSAPYGGDQTAETGRVEVENRLMQLKNLLDASITPETDATALSASTKEDVAEVKLFLDNLAFVLNSVKPSASIAQADIDAWKASVSAARIEVNGAITSIFTAEEKLSSAQSALLVAQDELNLDKAGTLDQQIEAEQGRVDQAEAGVEMAYADIAKATIKSPISGIVTNLDIELGETVSPNAPVVTVISDSQFEIEANIPEADIAKLSVGNEATVTLDAYGPDAVFAANIVRIDPAETIVDGVPTYKTTFQFASFDSRIKSGMTANITIKGAVRENAIAVPQKAIVSRFGKKYVTVKKGNATQEVEVKTGIRGSDGNVEILSGVSEGDSIVISAS